MPDAARFDVLFDSETTAPRCALEDEYGAALRIGGDRIAVNFVSTIDGIVSFARTPDDPRLVGGGALADRTLMAMLRAVAGVVVVGAGTLRAARDHQWTPHALLPKRRADLDALRAAAGLVEEPAPLLVVSGSGEVPLDAVAVTRPATRLRVLTRGGVVNPHDAVAGAGEDRATASLDLGAIRQAAAELASGPILCEGGPHLFGSLLEDGAACDLFLTLAPQLAGRGGPTSQRWGLVEGVALPPFARAATLFSVRSAGDHLMLRYRIAAGG